MTKRELPAELPEFNALAQNLQPLLENYLLDTIVGKRTDKWKTFTYEFRYLDTLARIFDVKLKNPCTSVVPLKGKEGQLSIGIAFNTKSTPQTVADIKRTAGLLQAAINDETKIPSFMIEAISKSQCYIYCIGKIQEKLKACEKIIITHPVIKGTLDEVGKLIKIVNTKTENAVLKQYEIVLISLTELLKADFTGDETSIKLKKDIFDKKTLEMLVRPYQDIQKIVKFFNKIGNNKIVYEIIDNPEGAHAELTASSYYFAKNGNNPEYVGISKLSCYLCDELLNVENQPHRGGHGILYLKDYKLPNKYESSASTKEFLALKLQEHLSKTLLSSPGEHILNTTLLNKVSKVTQFLSYYAQYMEGGSSKLTELFNNIPPRGDLDQFDDLSSDEGYEEPLLGQVKTGFGSI